MKLKQQLLQQIEELKPAEFKNGNQLLMGLLQRCKLTYQEVNDAEELTIISGCLILNETSYEENFFECLDQKDFYCVIAKNLTTVSKFMFHNATKLEIVFMPLVTKIEESEPNSVQFKGAFSFTNIREFYFSKLEKIPQYAFYGCGQTSNSQSEPKKFGLEFKQPELQMKLETKINVKEQIIELTSGLLKNQNDFSTAKQERAQLSESFEMITDKNLPMVTQIGDYAFCKSWFTQLRLSKLQQVGVGAFSQAFILRLDLPKLTEVGQAAFQDCPICTFNCPKLLAAGVSAFENCALKGSIHLNVCQKLGKRCFFGNKSLINVFAKKLLEVGQGCFSQCEKIKLIDCDRQLISCGLCDLESSRTCPICQNKDVFGTDYKDCKEFGTQIDRVGQISNELDKQRLTNFLMTQLLSIAENLTIIEKGILETEQSLLQETQKENQQEIQSTIQYIKNQMSQCLETPPNQFNTLIESQYTSQIINQLILYQNIETECNLIEMVLASLCFVGQFSLKSFSQLILILKHCETFPKHQYILKFNEEITQQLLEQIIQSCSQLNKNQQVIGVEWTSKEGVIGEMLQVLSDIGQLTLSSFILLMNFLSEFPQFVQFVKMPEEMTQQLISEIIAVQNSSRDQEIMHQETQPILANQLSKENLQTRNMAILKQLITYGEVSPFISQLLVANLTKDELEEIFDDNE